MLVSTFVSTLMFVFVGPQRFNPEWWVRGTVVLPPTPPHANTTKYTPVCIESTATQIGRISMDKRHTFPTARHSDIHCCYLPTVTYTVALNLRLKGYIDLLTVDICFCLRRRRRTGDHPYPLNKKQPPS
ncbi:hypothetical protein EDD37DRAFT_325571 [Exophiala viscosa]|uniref:uncharacterized protein n=1 Tax=Exophiala viscosa TaxID=2486360 RepID=UPI00219507EE|nr:hypothetical protein EDD37DRAFT_325571 [Exophiala viscosa]